MQAVRIEQYGGPEVLQSVEIPEPEPGPGEALVRIVAAGVNFIDVYHRSGLYPGELPRVLGLEGAGVVEKAGPDAGGIRAGERVAFTSVPGSYAQFVVVPTSKLVRIPEEIESKTAAAVMLQGLTAHYLACSTFPLGPEQTCLVHAGAGGVGQLLIQIAKQRGARVFTTVSTPEKAERAREAGADECILYQEQDFELVIRERTNGTGVDVVYDSVGQATFQKSLRSLRRRGCLVSFGQSSGKVPPLDPTELSKHGSLYLTRPSLFDYIAGPGELQGRAGELFEMIARGALKVHVHKELRLADARRAHEILEGRESIGKIILIP